MWHAVKGIRLYEEKGGNMGVPDESYVMEVVIGKDRSVVLTPAEVRELAQCLEDWADLNEGR